MHQRVAKKGSKDQMHFVRCVLSVESKIDNKQRKVCKVNFKRVELRTKRFYYKYSTGSYESQH